MTGWGKWIAAVAGLVLTEGIVGPSLGSAQQADIRAQVPSATEGPASEERVQSTTGRISLGLGADWASAYYFRGIASEQNGGSNVQPYAEVGFKLLENTGPLTSLVLTPGIWNNFHYGDGTLVDPSDPGFWFESDLYAKLSATWWEVFTTGVTYTYYTSPNDSFTSYADVGLSFGLNDAKWLGDFALNPSLLFAFETKGEALASVDGNKGIYMGIGLAPGYTFFADTPHPINVSAPMTAGFSVKDYYTVNGKNQTFGYFSGGPLFTVPLKFIPADYGSWSLRAGVQLLFLNSNLKSVNTGDSFAPIGNIGLTMTY